MIAQNVHIKVVVAIHSSNFTWNSESEGYYRRHRLSNGQFCQIAFYRYEYSRSTEYYVAFAVADKKKHLNGWFDQTKYDRISGKCTGRCGIEALAWARDMLLEFEDWVYIDKNEDTKIVVEGADSRRFRMYEKALSKYGYKKIREPAGWAMVKFIHREDVPIEVHVD